MSDARPGVSNHGTLNTGGGDVVGRDKIANHYYSHGAETREKFRSNIFPLHNRFVGREGLLRKISDQFEDRSAARVIALRGPAGVGKSELAQEFARLHLKEYAGGSFILSAEREELPVAFAKLGKGEFRTSFPHGDSREDQADWTLRELGKEPTLLIYDNVTSEDAVQRWLPRIGMSCHPSVPKRMRHGAPRV